MLIWNTTSVLNALLGGLLIGLAASLLLLLNGRIAGVSGIVGGLFAPQSDNRAWRIAFVLGLIISPWIYQHFAPLPLVTLKTNTTLLIIAGLLVGFGARLGGGCTSGHGVCGVARLSLRSIIATLTFISTGIATVFIMQTIGN